MATVKTVIVDTDSGATRDYATLNAAIAGENGATPAVVTSFVLTNGGVLAASLSAAGGTGYAVGNVLVVADAGRTQDCTVTVTTVDAGVITGIAFVSQMTRGAGYSTGVHGVTGGAGSGAEINVTSVTTHGGEQLTFSCRASAGAADTLATVTGFTTSATCYINIEAASAHRHSGVWDAAKYRIVAGDNVLTINGQPNVRVGGLQLSCTVVGRSSVYILNGSTNTRISGCIIKGPSATSTSSNRGIYCFDDTLPQDVYIWNNVISHHRYGIVNSGAGGTTLRVIANNTIHSCATNGITSTHTITNVLYNNIIQNIDLGNCFGNITGVVTTHEFERNITDDTSSPNETYRSITLTFEDAAGLNFQLDSTDTEAIDAGADMSANAYLAFSDDIAGTARPSAAWDIGAFEYVSSYVRPAGQLVTTQYHDIERL